jgi:hypothetical protein
MPTKLAVCERFVCPYRLRRLSVTATDVLIFKGGLQLEDPAGGFVAVRNAQFASCAIAIGVHGADPDRELPRDLL